VSERLDTIYGALSARVSLLWDREDIAGRKIGFVCAFWMLYPRRAGKCQIVAEIQGGRLLEVHEAGHADGKRDDRGFQDRD